MKALLILIALFSPLAFAYEVVDDKYVLLSDLTADGVYKALQKDISSSEKQKLVAAHLFIESVTLQGQDSFCQTVGRIYRNRSARAERIVARCKEVLRSESFTNDLVNDPPEYADSRELNHILSQMIALYILM